MDDTYETYNSINNCDRCDGCGQIADDKDGAPWTAWTSLPYQSAIAIRLGWVKPIPCPECEGSGKQARHHPNTERRPC